VRHLEPWYRKNKDAWFVQHHGKQVRLAKGKDSKLEAYQVFNKLMAGAKQSPAKSITAILCDLYLDWSKDEHNPTTQEWYRGLLVPDKYGAAVCYVICEPSNHYYRVMTGSERMPVLIGQHI